MPTAHEHFSARFHRWEVRGRGWRVFPEPVRPEPPFAPFAFRPMPRAADDGRRATLLSSLTRKIFSRPSPPAEEEPEEEPEPQPLSRGSLVEFQASLPHELDVPGEAFEQFLSSLSLCHEPVAFELLGARGKVAAQFAAAPADAPLLRGQLSAFFPEAVFIPAEGSLESAWDTAAGDEMLAVEFGLEREFMLPLADGESDPFIGIVGALSELRPGEFGLFQVLFQPARSPWAENIMRSVTLPEDRPAPQHDRYPAAEPLRRRPFFADAPELLDGAERKIARPLSACVVRILVSAEASCRVLQLATGLAASLRVFADPLGNALIPLSNDDYDFEDHIEDVLRRQTRRTGMILNSGELAGFVHIPSSAVRSPAFQRQTAKTKAAPYIACHESGLLLGSNEHAGQTVEIRLTAEQRVHHTHIIGASGTGKSTLLFNLIRQSIDEGEGIAVLDPHGDLIDRILGVIPPERIGDVILVDPSDAEYSVGFNILSAHSQLEKNLLASDLVAVFQRLSTSWGDQMNSVLQNAILAFLESDRRGTIADLRRFLVEPPFRSEFLKSVRDPEVVYYWQKSFPHLSGNKSIGSILTRLDSFLAQKPIRHMLSQPENRLDFARIMDGGKIFLAKLPEGLLGRENSHLLGTLLVSKFQQIAMSRQAQQVESRRLFNIVIDEFANFITPSMAEILSGARKYRIGLTLAHHELHQLQRSPEVASAVMTHPYTRIVFRVGDDDAKKLAEGFSYFESKDLRNLETGHAIARVERSDFDFNLTIPPPGVVDRDIAAARRQEVVTGSRRKYGTPRAYVEAMLSASRTPAPATPPTVAQKAPVEPKPSAATSTALPPAPIVAERPPLEEILKDAKPLLKQAPRDLGRGGPEHQGIQKDIRKIAEELGFLSVIEKPVLDGRCSVDLWLERDGRSIACEVSLTNTVDNEANKVIKCVRAGIPSFAMICLDSAKLRKIEAVISASLGSELAARVEYFQPALFIEYLKALPVAPKKRAETVSHGYKIKSSKPSGSTAEHKAKEEAAIRAIAEFMKKKRKQ